jgi:hypothetical protein
MEATAPIPLNDLKDRIYQCLPSGRYALSALLRLLDVVTTDAVKSAAVETRLHPRLLVNPEFVERHAQTPEKLMMLVMHELHHVLLGHTGRFLRQEPTDNLVFDAVINAMLSRMFPLPAYTALFTDFYRHQSFPACLLRPPPDWRPSVDRDGVRAFSPRGFAMEDRFVLPEALRVKGMGALARVYRQLYSAEGASYEELRRAIDTVIKRHKTDLTVELLGGHDRDRDQASDGGADAHDDPSYAAGLDDEPRSLAQRAFVQALSETVQQWPRVPDPVRGLSLQEALRDESVQPQAAPSKRQRLRELIQKVADSGGAGIGHWRPQPRSFNVDSPISQFNRRSAVLRGLGFQPLLHPQTVRSLQPQTCGQQIHLYVDVSGSMDSIKNALYGAVLDCEDLLHPQIHLFSERVVDMSIEDLRRGRCRSTGGTNIECVTRHIKRHGVKRAIVVTDGLVGEPRSQGREVLRSVRLGVAYIGQQISRVDLGGYAAVSVDL